LPASGKSTFARILSAFLEQGHISSSIVSYDDYYARLAAEKYGENTSDNFDPELWHQSRIQCVDQVENIIKSNDLPADSQHLIIVDDNMQYRSMRYPFFQFARRYKTGFIELYLECDMNRAIELNARRVGDQVVPVKTIEEMNSKLERPDPDKFKWEKHSIILNTAYGIDMGSVAQKLIELWHYPIPSIPITNIEENTKMKQENEKNLLHQADLRLRKLISTLMSKYPNLNGKQVSKWKSEFMAQMKQGKFQEMILDDEDLLVISKTGSAEQLAAALTRIEEYFMHQYFP
jgi:L-seryl-tRNA(Sec) kinase